MLIRYARVSTNEQDTATQVAALKSQDASGSFARRLLAAAGTRPELHRLLDRLRKGDVVVVWKLDRLSRSLRMS
jgi:DNA invertase Pin-like site-specific DNA recombinase